MYDIDIVVYVALDDVIVIYFIASKHIYHSGIHCIFNFVSIGSSSEVKIPKHQKLVSSSAGTGTVPSDALSAEANHGQYHVSGSIADRPHSAAFMLSTSSVSNVGDGTPDEIRRESRAPSPSIANIANIASTTTAAVVAANSFDPLVRSRSISRSDSGFNSNDGFPSKQTSIHSGIAGLNSNSAAVSFPVAGVGDISISGLSIVGNTPVIVGGGIGNISTAATTIPVAPTSMTAAATNSPVLLPPRNRIPRQVQRNLSNAKMSTDVQSTFDPQQRFSTSSSIDSSSTLAAAVAAGGTFKRRLSEPNDAYTASSGLGSGTKPFMSTAKDDGSRSSSTFIDKIVPPRRGSGTFRRQISTPINTSDYEVDSTLLSMVQSALAKDNHDVGSRGIGSAGGSISTTGPSAVISAGSTQKTGFGDVLDSFLRPFEAMNSKVVGKPHISI